MKAAVIVKPKEPFVFEERPLPQAGPGQIRINVKACGVCHSDYHIWEGHFTFARLPLIPGHEVAGTVDQIGEGVKGWKIGDRAGMPWIYSTCGVCEACSAGDDPGCPEQLATGVTVDGGYAPYMVAPANFATKIPEEIDFAEAAPLFCAGLTVYGGLKAGNIASNMTVAVHGIGGLGHLGIQYAKSFGSRVVAITRGKDKAEFAKSLGAHDIIDTKEIDPGEALQKMGGAHLILTTVTDGNAMAPLVKGLARKGSLVMVGAAVEPVPVVPLEMIVKGARVIGSIVGNRKEMREVLDIAVRHNIRPVIEKYKLEDIDKIYERLIKNLVRYRAVITFD